MVFQLSAATILLWKHLWAVHPRHAAPTSAEMVPNLMKFEDQIGSVFLKNIEKPLDIYTKKINHWYKTDVNYSWQMVISLQSLKWPEEKAKLPHLASKSNSWQSGFTATDHGFSSPFPKSKGLVGFDHLWPSCPSQVWASVGKVQDETANGHGASPWHQTKNQRVCRTDNLDSGLWQKNYDCGDAWC